MATQASIVVLVPVVVEIGRDLDASVSAVGQARSILAGTAVLASLAIGAAIDRLGVRPLLILGSALALAGAGATAAAPSLMIFYLASALTGLGVASLLSAGFAGVAAYFEGAGSGRATGYVVGAQSIAWIAGTPLVGVLTEAGSWRLAYAVPAAASLAALIGAVVAPRRGRASPAPTARESPGEGETGPMAVARDPSARRWALAELVAYSAWTADLTYAGAFYIQTYGTSESTVGSLLAAGSAAFLAATLATAWLSRRLSLRALVSGAGLGMGVLLAVVLNVTPSVWFTLGLVCVLAVFAGVRATGSSNLGLWQLPSRPGSMMAARTTSAQLGYLVGAGAGGAVLAVGGFGTLGFALLAGMAAASLLVLRVTELGEGPARTEPGVAAPSRRPAPAAAE